LQQSVTEDASVPSLHLSVTEVASVPSLHSSVVEIIMGTSMHRKSDIEIAIGASMHSALPPAQFEGGSEDAARGDTLGQLCEQEQATLLAPAPDAAALAHLPATGQAAPAAATPETLLAITPAAPDAATLAHTPATGQAAPAATPETLLAGMPAAPDAQALTHVPATGQAAPAATPKMLLADMPAAPGAAALAYLVVLMVAFALPETFTLRVLAATCAYHGPYVNADEAVDTPQKMTKNVADGFTKPLTKAKFTEFVKHFLIKCNSGK